MASVFYLKYRDTRPVLEVALKNPDGTAMDLTGSTSWKLHIKLNDGSTLMRNMVKEGADALGVLRYTWIATDWDAVSAGGTVGGLVVGPTKRVNGAGVNVEAHMEYEVIAGTSRLTFPNNDYDILRIIDDIGQG